MPAAGRQSPEDRPACHFLVEMERLRVEFGGEGLDLLRVHRPPVGGKGLTRLKIFKIAFDHRSSSSHTRNASHGRQCCAPPLSWPRESCTWSFVQCEAYGFILNVCRRAHVRRLHVEPDGVKRWEEEQDQ